ncbi:MAG: hypothetical protein GY941_02915 [Planctomycetes bacterium]|nr:hypothetical protein [Planctomycetota bacterium]
MVRYSCDMCGRSITPEEDVRYVIKIEAYAACESADVEEEDFDEELIEDFDEEDEEEFGDFEADEQEEVDYKTFRFDLCSKCHSKYLQDPLSIKSIRRNRFSEN